jgi:hypothetical protein
VLAVIVILRIPFSRLIPNSSDSPNCLSSTCDFYWLVLSASIIKDQLLYPPFKVFVNLNTLKSSLGLSSLRMFEREGAGSNLLRLSI